MARRSNLTRAVWFKVDEETDEVIRLIAWQTERDNSEVGREAIRVGLASVAGYAEALAAYRADKRAPRAQARGGHPAGRKSTGRRVPAASA